MSNKKEYRPRVSEDEYNVLQEYRKNKESFTVDSISETKDYNEEVDTDALKQYCKEHNIDYSQVKSAKYINHMGQKQFNVVLNTDYQNQHDISEYISAVKEAVKEHNWEGQPDKTSSKNLFTPCIFDLHLGKLAWGEETGEDYDSKIAVTRFQNALEDLIKKSEGYEPQKILFPVGNDIYNSDKSKPFPQTTNGTPQMDDLRWQKMFRLGIKMITEAVIRLAKVAPVEVVTIFSNHDHERVFYLGETLSAVFENHPSVNVDNSPKVRKYFRWGECLLGLAHGHNEKPTDLPLTMAQEAKKDWAKTFYREWLLGHLHHQKKYQTQTTKDYSGVRVTYLTSPSAADAWHYERNFTGAIKGAEGYIYNKDEGLIGIVAHNIK